MFDAKQWADEVALYNTAKDIGISEKNKVLRVRLVPSH
jgi:hypothetical protein